MNSSSKRTLERDIHSERGGDSIPAVVVFRPSALHLLILHFQWQQANLRHKKGRPKAACFVGRKPTLA